MGVPHDNLAHHGQHLSASSDPTVDDDDAINILLVEDNYADALLMLNALNAADFSYTVDRIDNGDDVLPYLEEALPEKMPDIIFLDMELPGTDGFEILERLADASEPVRSVPIVIITMQSILSRLKETYDLPIYGHLTKPVNVESVKTLLSDFPHLVGAKRQAAR